MHDHDHSHDHDHDHGDGPGHAQAHPKQPDIEDLPVTETQRLEAAVRELLIEKGVFRASDLHAMIEAIDSWTPAQGGRIVARAWVDPEFKARLLADAPAAAREVGVEPGPTQLVVVENTPERHNLIVCTLCSCYPRSLLGEPPAWYVSKAYRSRAVREPRKVLREFGLAVPDDVEVRVHDSNADMRYVVIPMRPDGTEGMSETELAALVTRDCLVGAALPGR